MKKTCRKCNTERFVSQFHRDSGRKDGRKAVCAFCENERNRMNADKKSANKSYQALLSSNPSDYKINSLHPLVVKNWGAYGDTKYYERGRRRIEY